MYLQEYHRLFNYLKSKDVCTSETQGDIIISTDNPEIIEGCILPDFDFTRVIRSRVTKDSYTSKYMRFIPKENAEYVLYVTYGRTNKTVIKVVLKKEFYS